MPAGTVRRHPFIHRFSQREGRVSCSAHNLTGPGALGTAAHFEASNNSSAITVDESGTVKSFHLRLAGMKIVRLNYKPASKDLDRPFDDLLLCAQTSGTTVLPPLKNWDARSRQRNTLIGKGIVIDVESPFPCAQISGGRITVTEPLFDGPRRVAGQ